MKISSFNSGKYISQTEYKSFLPSKINQEWEIDQPKVLTLLEEANLKLGELNAYSKHVPDVNTFIRMHVIKEATKSSQIEGTQTEIAEAARSEKLIIPEKRDDWREVQNYIRAMNETILSLDQIPLSSRLLRNAHQTLMQGARGEHKLPGEFRRSQNWIGGATLKDAAYIPPTHDRVPDLMSDLEHFLHNKTIYVPHLIRIAIAHYQFETIHPFLDGNGRIGRLLITLYLISNKIIDKPVFYISTFFEKNREIYYNNLNSIRENNELVKWIKFFLVGANETAENAIITLQKIQQLNIDSISKISTLGKRTPLANKLLAHLYKFPTVNSSDLVSELNITKPTANAIIEEFIKLNILRETTGFKRNKIFIFETYLNLFRA